VLVDFDAELWVWDARPGENWTFVSLPADVSEEIRELTGDQRRGFGSVRVQARIGASVWRTSIFPGASGAYALPVKRAIRTAQGLNIGDRATVSVELVDL
jgi:uncharacterized protein DUF1905